MVDHPSLPLMNTTSISQLAMLSLELATPGVTLKCTSTVDQYSASSASNPVSPQTSITTETEDIMHTNHTSRHKTNTRPRMTLITTLTSTRYTQGFPYRTPRIFLLNSDYLTYVFEFHKDNKWFRKCAYTLFFL